MKILKEELGVLFLIGSIIYGCSPLRQSSKPPAVEATTSGVASTTPLPLFKGKPKEIFLLKNVVSQNYFLTVPDSDSMIPLDVPVNIRGLAMSPNGRMIAYISNDDAALYLFDTKSKMTNILVNSRDLQPGIGLAWSPDSQTIAFSCRVQGTLGLSLCSVNITNRENIQILVKSQQLGALDVLDGAISPAWSTDGSNIAFLSSSAPSSSSDGKIASTRDIWLFDVPHHTAKLIFANGTEGISYIFEPYYLSEQNTLIFSGRKENFNTIFAYQVASQNIRDITSTGSSFDLADFVSSPDEESFLVELPSSENSIPRFVPTLYSFDGRLLARLTLPVNFQVVSWSVQQ